MEKLNNGTKKIVLNLLILKDKLVMATLPDESYILMGINIVEKIVKKVNPLEITNDEIDIILDTINKEVEDNQFQMLSFSVMTGMEMAFNTIKKMKTKTLKR